MALQFGGMLTKPFLLHYFSFKKFFSNDPGPLINSTPLFHKLNILTIFDIYKLQLGKFVFESLNNIGPPIINFTLVSEIHRYNTHYARNNNLFNNYVRTTNYGLKSIQIEGSKLWANVPIIIKNSPSKTVFKTRLKKLLIDHYK